MRVFLRIERLAITRALAAQMAPFVVEPPSRLTFVRRLRGLAYVPLSHSCAVCMVLQITTGIHSINAAGMQSVQYIHQDFLDCCIPCNTSVRVFLTFCCSLACVFNGGAFTLVIYSANVALASNVLSALSFDFVLSHCLMVRLPL